MIFSQDQSNVDDLEEMEQNDETELENQEEINEEKNYEKKQTPEIPDSMTIKHNFLEQLSDKLASIKRNSVNNNNKKWSKNNSGNLVSTTPKGEYMTSDQNQSNTNSDLMSDSDLLNSVDMSNLKKMENNLMKKGHSGDLGELNKSKSKWGVNCGSESIRKNDNNSHNMNKNTEDSDELNNGETGKKISKRKAGSNFTRQKTDNEKDDKNSDDLGNLPSLQGKKVLDNHSNMIPASSQIQITMWNDDSGQNKANVNTRASHGSRAQKNANNHKNDADENRNKQKNDQITDRILTAAKAASTSKNYMS